MKRRQALKFVSVGAAAAIGGKLAWQYSEKELPSVYAPESSPIYEDMVADSQDMAASIRYLSTPAPDAEIWLQQFQEQIRIKEAQQAKETGTVKLHSYLRKMQDFESTYTEDVFLPREKYRLLVSAFKRLNRVQNLVGHGNFNVLSFDEMRKYGRRYAIG